MCRHGNTVSLLNQKKKDLARYLSTPILSETLRQETEYKVE